MGSDRLRVLVLAVISLGLVLASTWVLDWFVLTIVDVGSDGATLSEATGRGLWGKLSKLTLWTSNGFAVIVAAQAAMRVFGGQAIEGLTRIGYAVGIGAFIVVFMTAFFFQPELPVVIEGVDLHRTWAPLLLFVGILAGVFTLYFALQDSESVAIAPPAPPGLPEARVVTRDRSEPTAQPGAHPTQGDAVAPGSQPIRTRTRPITNAPEPLRYKLAFAAATAEVTKGGVDARREDGSTVLVVWRDVVGVVVRKLPPTQEGATFVDLVSTAGSTLRFLPWTRMTGEPLTGDADGRARALVQLVVSLCPNVQIDLATRQFLEAKAPAAQLPDAETLAAHDARLA